MTRNNVEHAGPGQISTGRNKVREAERDALVFDGPSGGTSHLRLSDISIQWKLLGSFAAMLACLLAVVAGAYVAAASSVEATNEIAQTHAVVADANAALSGLLDIEAGYRGFLLTGRDEYLDPVNAGRQTFRTHVQSLEVETADDPAGNARWQDVIQQETRWERDVVQAGINQRRAVTQGTAWQTDVAATVSQGDGERQFAAMRQVLSETIQGEQNLLALREARARSSSNFFRATLLGGALGGILLTLFFIWLAVGDLLRPLRALVHTAEKISRGNLDLHLVGDRRDEIGVVTRAFDKLTIYLRDLSATDQLTGTPNRRSLQATVAVEFYRARRYGRPLTLLLIDVDNFKAVNNRYGHPAGDVVLWEVSQVIRRSLRATDVVGRWGGEEYLVILPETTGEGGAEVAERIRGAIERHQFTAGPGHQTVSIGVAADADDIRSSDALVGAADQALYGAKSHGPNRIQDTIDQVLPSHLVAAGVD